MTPPETTFQTLFGELIESFWYPDRSNPDQEILYARIRIRCPKCKTRNGRPAYHYHGFNLGEPSGQGGHRVAHCDKADSMPDGYCIAVSPDGNHVVDPFTKVVRPSKKLRLEKIRLDLRIHQILKQIDAGQIENDVLFAAILEMDKIKARLQAATSPSSDCGVHP